MQHHHGCKNTHCSTCEKKSWREVEEYSMWGEFESHHAIPTGTVSWVDVASTAVQATESTPQNSTILTPWSVVVEKKRTIQSRKALYFYVYTRTGEESRQLEIGRGRTNPAELENTY